MQVWGAVSGSQLEIHAVEAQVEALLAGRGFLQSGICAETYVSIATSMIFIACSFHGSPKVHIKQVRKLRWSVAFVILQNFDLLSHLVTLVPPGQCAAKQPLTKTG